MDDRRDLRSTCSLKRSDLTTACGVCRYTSTMMLDVFLLNSLMLDVIFSVDFQ
jgi:hypothetical protein